MFTRVAWAHGPLVDDSGSKVPMITAREAMLLGLWIVSINKPEIPTMAESLTTFATNVQIAPQYSAHVLGVSYSRIFSSVADSNWPFNQSKIAIEMFSTVGLRSEKYAISRLRCL